MPAVVLPGPRLFQANRVDPKCMRPAVFHCFLTCHGFRRLGNPSCSIAWCRAPLPAMATNRMDSVWGNVLAWLCLRGHTQRTLTASPERVLETCWPASRASMAVVQPGTCSSFAQAPNKGFSDSCRTPELCPGIETNATAAPGGPLGPPAASASTRSMPSMPLPSRQGSTKPEVAQVPKSEPDASDPTGRPLGLSAASSAAGAVQGALLSTASDSTKPEKADVPKLNSDASDQLGRPLGLSAAGSASRSFTGPLLQFAHESAKPEEAGEAEGRRVHGAS